MNIHLSTEDALKCSALLGEVQAKAEAAAKARDTETARRALHGLWAASHRAHNALMEAERNAREGALKRIA